MGVVRCIVVDGGDRLFEDDLNVAWDALEERDNGLVYKMLTRWMGHHAAVHLMTMMQNNMGETKPKFVLDFKTMHILPRRAT